MSNLIGQELGPYRILEQIGAGGMATVYKAYHAAMDRYVAVKVLPEQMSASAEFRQRFEQEAKVIARLAHAHILPVHDYGQVNERLYLVMRYVEAGTLKNRLAADPIDLKEVNRIFRQVASALDYAHRLGVVHRDVKPSNVLLDDQGNCYLTDFGLAKMLEASAKLTATGVGMGTPAYMSPEQGKGDAVDARSDLYSLGVMLYEMVTGRVPYEAETPMAVVLKHINDPLPLPSKVKPGVPPSVERVILKAMAKEPEDRFQTAGEIAAALEAAARMAPTETPLPVAELPVAPRERVSNRFPARLRELVQSGAGRAVVWGVVGLGALLLFFGILSNIPLKVQVSGGRLEVVRVVETTPALSEVERETQRAMTTQAAAKTTATVPLQPSTTPTTPAEALPTSESLPVAQATATPPPPPASPTAVPTKNLNVTPLILYEDAADHLAWSPEGTLLAIGGHNIDLYDAQTRQKIQELGTGTARNLTFSSDGTILAWEDHEAVHLWDTGSWSELRALPGSSGTDAIAFSPDGSMLATATGSTVKLWDVASGAELRTVPAGSSLHTVAFSPDGRTVASGGLGEIQLWDATTGQELHTLKGHTNWVHSLAFSPDGTILASGSVDSTVRLWEVSSGRQLRLLSGHTGQVESIAFSPDGVLLASASWDLTVRLWDVASGEELAALTGHASWITCVAFSPDGTMLASGSGDQMRLWRIEVGTAMPEPTPTAMSPATSIATPVPLSESAIAPENAHQVAMLQFLETDGVKRIAWSPDGSLLAVATYHIRLYDGTTFAPGYVIDSVQWVYSLAFSADGSLLAAPTGDGVRLWDTNGWGELQTLIGSKDTADIAFSPDGALLVTATGSTVKVWDVASGSELRTIPAGSSLNAVAFSPDGRTLASGGQGDVKLWDVTTGKELYTLKGHTNWVKSVTFSSDGTMLASGSVDNSVRLWDVATGRQIRVLSGHTSQVESVAFSPDGRLVASASWDLTVRLWDVASGSELTSLTGHSGWITSVAFSPDGAMLASGSETVRLWGIAP